MREEATVAIECATDARHELPGEDADGMGVRGERVANGLGFHLRASA
jgi:hypothetical protein